jgi:hypothetical protein
VPIDNLNDKTICMLYCVRMMLIREMLEFWLGYFEIERFTYCLCYFANVTIDQNLSIVL